MVSFCDGNKKLYSFIKAGELLDKQEIRELNRHYRLFCTILLNHTFLYTKCVPSRVRVFFMAQQSLVGQG